MNLADLTSFLTLITFAIGTPVSANSAGAPLWVTLSLILIGSVVGLGTAHLNGHMMSYFLGTQAKPSPNSQGHLLLYILFPFFALIASIAGAVGLGHLVALTLNS